MGPLLRLMEACKARHESLNGRFDVCAMLSPVRGFRHRTLRTLRTLRTWGNRWIWRDIPKPAHGILTTTHGKCAPYKEEQLPDGSLDDGGLFCHKCSGPGLSYGLVMGN